MHPLYPTRLIGLSTLDTLAARLNALVGADHLNITHTKTGAEGRSTSIENEHEIRSALQDYFEQSGGTLDSFSLSIPAGTRFWYDFALVGSDGSIVPVNIKATTSRSPDNCGSKEGVYFSLTGLLPSAAVCRDYDSYFHALGEGISTALEDSARQARDYHFLVCLKGRGEAPRFFTQSLRSIESLTPNGNNPPFQCHWARNQKPANRDFAAGALNVLMAYKASMAQRAAQYTKFQTSLDPVIRLLESERKV